MASQSSVLSSASTVPPDLIVHQDDDFIQELEEVDQLYFSNVETVTNEQGERQFESDDHDHDEYEDESDASDGSDEDKGNFDTEHRPEDTSEFEKQNDFFEKTCGCNRLNKVPCSSLVNREMIIDYREACLETDKRERDMIIKVQLYAHRKSTQTTDAKKHKAKERERIYQDYFFNGQQVCRNTFNFAHAIGKSQLESICKSLHAEGFKPRTHGNKGKSPKHALDVNEIQHIIQFLNQYANTFGVPLPGRLPNHRSFKVTLLPSDKTKADIHQEYLKAASDMGYRAVCVSEFKKVWLDFTPTIVVMKPATDLCGSCQQYSSSISQSGNMVEEEKVNLLRQYETHLDRTKIERDYYRDQCQQSKENFNNMTDLQKNRGNPKIFKLSLY